MARRALPVGIVGCGFITQAVHLPSLMELGDRFEVVAAADPSVSARELVQNRYGIGRVFSTAGDMMDEVAIEAVLVLSPGATHFDVVMDALGRGLHVFAEKPLCLASGDAAQIAKKSDETGLTVQVGYMKQYDPALQALLRDLSQNPRPPRLLTIATHDPMLQRFFGPATAHQGDVVAAPEQMHPDHLSQVQRAVGVADPGLARIYVEMFADTLIHDVNLLNSILRALRHISDPRVIDSAWWAEGRALSAVLALPSGARCSLSLLELPQIQDFREEVRVYFANVVHQVSFPAPYVRRVSARYEAMSEQAGLSSSQSWRSWNEGFVLELAHFHAAIKDRATCLTPASQAVDDLRLLERLFIAGLADEERLRRSARPEG